MIGSLRNRTRVLGVSAAAVAVLLSACGGYKSASPAAYATTPAAPAPATSGASHVDTRSIGGIGAVLVDGKGLTLYHLTTDTSAKSTCTGGCAKVWPPLLTTNGNPPSSPASIGTFGMITRPDGGAQVTFNGMPLYTYAGDSRPGQANGQGIMGTWFAVTS
jgi:predicted lipoprotein with Yx(FWY)xxD motif